VSARPSVFLCPSFRCTKDFTRRWTPNQSSQFSKHSASIAILLAGTDAQRFLCVSARLACVLRPLPACTGQCHSFLSKEFGNNQ
jgi:hypothetical protein